MLGVSICLCVCAKSPQRSFYAMKLGGLFSDFGESFAPKSEKLLEK